MVDGGRGSGGKGGGVRSLSTSAAPSFTKMGSSKRLAITISALINSSASAQSHALQLEHLALVLRCLLTRLLCRLSSASSLSSSSESSSSPSPSTSSVGTVSKRFEDRFSPRALPITTNDACRRARARTVPQSWGLTSVGGVTTGDALALFPTFYREGLRVAHTGPMYGSF